MLPRHFFIAAMVCTSSAIAAFLCWTASQSKQKKDFNETLLAREKHYFKQFAKQVQREKEKITLDFFAYAIPRKQFALHFFNNFSILDEQFNDLRVLMNTYPRLQISRMTSVREVQSAYQQLEEHHNLTIKLSEELLREIQESTFEVIIGVPNV